MDERHLLEDWAQLISFRPRLPAPRGADVHGNDHLAERLPQP